MSVVANIRQRAVDHVSGTFAAIRSAQRRVSSEFRRAYVVPSKVDGWEVWCEHDASYGEEFIDEENNTTSVVPSRWEACCLDEFFVSKADAESFVNRRRELPYEKKHEVKPAKRIHGEHVSLFRLFHPIATPKFLARVILETTILAIALPVRLLDFIPKAFFDVRPVRFIVFQTYALISGIVGEVLDDIRAARDDIKGGIKSDVESLVKAVKYFAKMIRATAVFLDRIRHPKAEKSAPSSLSINSASVADTRDRAGSTDGSVSDPESVSSHGSGTFELTSTDDRNGGAVNVSSFSRVLAFALKMAAVVVVKPSEPAASDNQKDQCASAKGIFAAANASRPASSVVVGKAPVHTMSRV